MAIVNVFDSSDVALDYLVAKCENLPNLHIVKKPGKVCVYGEISNIDFPYQPSTDWYQGGPIIERENISVMRVYKDAPLPWCAERGEEHFMYAPTPLIAAMRCYVASKLGGKVEVPDELIS